MCGPAARETLTRGASAFECADICVKESNPNSTREFGSLFLRSSELSNIKDSRKRMISFTSIACSREKSNNTELRTHVLTGFVDASGSTELTITRLVSTKSHGKAGVRGVENVEIPLRTSFKARKWKKKKIPSNNK